MLNRTLPFFIDQIFEFANLLAKSTACLFFKAHQLKSLVQVWHLSE